MKWKELHQIVGREPIFHSSILITTGGNPADLGRQLSRWVNSGNLIQLRRGLYALSEQYQKTIPHTFLVANRLKRASYVSMQSALEFYGLILEHVPSVTSVTTGRPDDRVTPLGSFIYRHIKKALFFAYRTIDLGDDQSAFIATPEKALLDLLYLTPGSDDPDYLRELRLQNVQTLNKNILTELADRSGSQKLLRAVLKIEALVSDLKES